MLHRAARVGADEEGRLRTGTGPGSGRGLEEAEVGEMGKVEGRDRVVPRRR